MVSIFTKIVTFFAGSSIFSILKYISLGLGVLTILYLYFDYKSTKENLAKANQNIFKKVLEIKKQISIQKKTVEAYEETIDILEELNTEKLLQKEDEIKLIEANKSFSKKVKKRQGGKRDKKSNDNTAFVVFF
jgi:exopolyphosphatase/pppGpp-phosphohydrolase